MELENIFLENRDHANLDKNVEDYRLSAEVLIQELDRQRVPMLFSEHLVGGEMKKETSIC